MSNAVAWNHTLTSILLPDGLSGRVMVRLACDDVVVETAALELGVKSDGAAAALVADLKSEKLVSEELGLGPLVAANNGQPPLYLLGLDLLVLAASRMTSDEHASMRAYYARLADLLELPMRETWPGVLGVRELVERFKDLEKWMRDHERGSRGVLDLEDDPHPAIVGVPINQTLLRAGDRDTLKGFFLRAGRVIDAGWDPVTQLRRWGGRHRLSLPLQQLLDRPDLRDALGGALRGANRNWDGTILNDEGRTVVPSRLTLYPPPAPLAIGLSIPSVSGPVEVSGPDGDTIAVPAVGQASVPLDWLDHARSGALIRPAGNNLSVRVLPAQTILFEVTGAALGLESVDVALDSPIWALTCDEVLIDRCDEASRNLRSLPQGWVLLCDIDPQLLSRDLRVEAGEESELAGVEAVGGLKMGEGVWLFEHPPALVCDLPEPSPVTVDGVSHGDIERDQQLSLEQIAGKPGVHQIVVGEQEINIELVEHGPEDGVGGLGFVVDDHLLHAGVRAVDETNIQRICGPLVHPETTAASTSIIVRYRCAVDVITVDGNVQNLGPPQPAAWHTHVGLPDAGPWEVPDADRVAWLCVEAQSGRFVVSHRAVDVPVTDEVLDLVEDFVDVTRIVDRSDGRAPERWDRLLSALEAAS